MVSVRAPACYLCGTTIVAAALSDCLCFSGCCGFRHVPTFFDGVGHACCGRGPSRGVAQPSSTWVAAAYDGIIHLDFIRCSGLSGQSGWARVSESCSTLAFGLAQKGPFLSEILPSDMSGFGADCSFHRTTASLVGLHSAIWQIWPALASSSVFGVDWRSGVC